MMLLNKSLCIKCYNAHRKKPWEKQAAKERSWERGKIACVAVNERGPIKMVSIKCLPDQCYFHLEQVLTQEGV
jgi:hypothetical protein